MSDSKISYDDSSCKIPIGDCVKARRCFMSGEYCSKQTDIYRAREKLHSLNTKEINAFVIMNFSGMSDVMYEWRLKPFIEGLKDYLYFEEKMVVLSTWFAARSA